MRNAFRSGISLNWEPRDFIKVIDSRVKIVLMVACLEYSFNSTFSDVLVIFFFPQRKSADKLASVLVPVS